MKKLKNRYYNKYWNFDTNRGHRSYTLEARNIKSLSKPTSMFQAKQFESILKMKKKIITH